MVLWLDAFDENFAFVGADFHAVTSSSFSSLSVSCWSASSLPPSRSMSSAKRKLQSGRPPMDTDDSGMPVSSASSTASPAKQSFPMDAEVSKLFALYIPRRHQNNTRYNGHPGCTHTVVRKKPSTLPFSNTVLVASSYNEDRMTSVSRCRCCIRAYSFKTRRQRPSCQTRSNAFLKSTKL